MIAMELLNLTLLVLLTALVSAQLEKLGAGCSNLHCSENFDAVLFCGDDNIWHVQENCPAGTCAQPTVSDNPFCSK